MHRPHVSLQPLGAIEFDADATIVGINEAAAALLGYQPADVQGRCLALLVADSEQEPAWRSIDGTVAPGPLAAQGMHLTFIRKCGTPLPIWTTVCRAADTRGGFEAHVMYLTPPMVVERVGPTCVEQVLRDIGVGVLLTDADLNIVAINRAFSQMTGYSESDVLGKSPRLLRSGRHNGSFYRQMWKTLRSSGSWHGEIWNRRRNGEIYPERLSISVVRDSRDQIQNYLGLFYDISDEVLRRQELDELANNDDLTGLMNRRSFLLRLERAAVAARRSGKAIALLFVDLDNFKDINDKYGHAAGDLVLRRMAERLQGSVRQNDSVGRWGGDEMVVLLTGAISADNAAAVARKIMTALSAPIHDNANEYRLTVSVGIALYPEHATTAAELIDRADEAMYRVKWGGRNGYGFAGEDGDEAPSA